MGATMSQDVLLFTANVFEQIDQRRVGRNALPFTHDALRINDFTRQHGATVHGELQHVHHFFAAVHFHVRACGHVKRASLRSLRRFVIEQAPERSDGACALDGGVVHVNDARIGGGDLLPLGMRRMRCQDDQRRGGSGQSVFQKVRNAALAGLRCRVDLNESHTPYYKVELRS